MIARDWRRSSATGTAHKNMFGERGLLGTREIMCRTGTSKVTGVALAEAVLAQGERGSAALAIGLCDQSCPMRRTPDSAPLPGQRAQLLARQALRLQLACHAPPDRRGSP